MVTVNCEISFRPEHYVINVDPHKHRYQALWSNDSAVLSMPSQSPEDWDEDCAFFLLLILHKM